MHVVSRPPPPTRVAEGRWLVHQVPAATDNLVWLIQAVDGPDAAAVDGPDAQSVLSACDALGLRLTTILNTHTHYDHIGINAALGPQLSEMRVVGPRSRADEVPGLTEPVGDGDCFDLFGVNVKVMLTEGHIDGHISYYVPQALFCGDTMFGAGCGYLFDGPPAKMHASLQRLAQLPPETYVFCAHEYTQDNLRFAWSVEPSNSELAERIRNTWSIRAEGRSSIPSTIELERRTNPFIRVDSPELLAQLRTLAPHLRLDSGEEVFAATRALKDSKAYRALQDDGLPLGSP